MTRRRLVLAAAALALACDASFENAPRVTPAGESLWLMVGLQIRLDATRAFLVQHPHLSVNPGRIDTLCAQVLATSESLTSHAPGEEELRVARYRVDLAAVAWDLIQADVLASVGGIGGTTHAATMQGLGWINDGFDSIGRDPLWPVRQPREADRLVLMAVSHRDNIRRSIPASALMRDGVNAAALTSGAIAAVRLVGTGVGALVRVMGFVGEGGGGPALVTAGFAGGVGAIQVLAGGRSLVLTTQEVIALVKAGVLSTAVLALYMQASDTHHICTDKNTVSDKQGGPWTPRFEEYFKKAGMSLQDPENLVQAKAHQGPHPRAYHEAVLRRIRDAVESQRAGTAEYREALKRALATLAKEIQTPGTKLNLLVTGAIPK